MKNIKRFFCSLLAICLCCSQFQFNVLANDSSNEIVREVLEENENVKIVELTEDELSLKIYKDKTTGDFKLEKYINGNLEKRYEGNLYEHETNSLQTRQIDGTVIETEAGWGIFLPYSETHYAFSCPIDFANEIESLDGTRTFEIDRGINDLYAKQFQLYLEAYLEDEEALDDCTTSVAFSAITAALVGVLAMYLGSPALAYQACLEIVDVAYQSAKANKLMESLAELQDGMAFYYIELYREIS